jgi:hypothetical protein
VKNKPERVQHVLKMQFISLLPIYMGVLIVLSPTYFPMS